MLFVPRWLSCWVSCWLSCCAFALALHSEEGALPTVLPPLTPETATLWVQTTTNPTGSVIAQGDGTVTVVDGGVDLIFPKITGLQLAVLNLPVVSSRLVAGKSYRFRCVMRATLVASAIVAYPEHAWEKPVTTPPTANTTWHQVDVGDTVITGTFVYVSGVNRDTISLIFSPDSAASQLTIRAVTVEPLP